jgi:hypothetical protein
VFDRVLVVRRGRVPVADPAVHRGRVVQDRSVGRVDLVEVAARLLLGDDRLRLGQLLRRERVEPQLLGDREHQDDVRRERPPLAGGGTGVSRPAARIVEALVRQRGCGTRARDDRGGQHECGQSASDRAVP